MLDKGDDMYIGVRKLLQEKKEKGIKVKLSPEFWVLLSSMKDEHDKIIKGVESE